MSEPAEDMSDEELAEIIAAKDTQSYRRREAWDEFLDRGYHHPRQVLEE